jgi:hypothetical protein
MYPTWTKVKAKKFAQLGEKVGEEFALGIEAYTCR